MPNSKHMNDWNEFQKQMNDHVNRQVTSNKTLLWVAISVNGIVTAITLVVAIVALIYALMVSRDNLAMQKELADCKTEIRTSVLKIKHNCEKERHSQSCDGYTQ